MKSYRKELTINTRQRYQLLRITDQVQQALAESGIQEGLCLVNSMQMTLT